MKTTQNNTNRTQGIQQGASQPQKITFPNQCFKNNCCKKKHRQ